MDLKPDDLIDDVRAEKKGYGAQTPIAGVELFTLARHVDDRGLFLELYRNAVTHAGSEPLRAFFRDVEIAQLSYSLVTADAHVKGLHSHLRQADLWFCPPPFKLKAVLLDVRRASPTAGRTQTVVLGDGRDLWVRIPPGVAHGYRPLTTPCGLLYVTTRCFDLSDPDEYRIRWDHPAVKDLWAVRNE